METQEQERRYLDGLAGAIREAREQREWSRSKLARMIDSPEKNVRNWEIGTSYPSYPYYVRLCLIFGWPLSYPGDSSTAR